MKKIFTLISIFSVSTVGLWAQATPNPGFETWTTTGIPSYAVCTGWDSPNSQTNIPAVFVCIKATVAADIHSGAAALKLVTKNITILGVANLAPGVVTTGTLPTSTSGNITGGIPYTLRPDSIVGYYKAAPVGGDNGFVEFALLGAGGSTDTIAIGTFNMPTTAVTTYTRFSKKIVYRSANAVVNSVWVICSSGNTPVSGSTLFIDDIGLVMPSAANVTEQSKLELTVGPNPTNGHVVIKNTLNSKAVFVLYDITGRKVAEEKIVNTSNFIDVSTFPVGLYIYSIKDENNNAVKTGKLIIQK